MTTRSVGPRPGSVAGDDAPDTAIFKRIYSKPSQLRILVRANCNTRVGQQSLIEKAKSNSLPSGPVVQLDWERVRDKEVVFWAVASSETEVVTINLEKKDGRYVSKGSQKNTTETWDVQQIIFPIAKGNPCVNETALAKRDMRIALVNFLNSTTLSNFRRPIIN